VIFKELIQSEREEHLMIRLGFYRRTAAFAAVAAGALTLAGIAPARAFVISDTPTLPLLGVPYVTQNNNACFPLANVCVTGGSIILTPPVSPPSFNAAGQDITSGALYSGTLTDLLHHPIGPVQLSGSVEQEVLGRSFATQTGSWTVDLLSLSLSGSVLGHTLTLGLDPSHESTGITSITAIGSSGARKFRIDSFFDVFVELSLDTVPPLTATREIRAEAVPEPSSLAAIGAALAMLLGIGRRRVAASPKAA
jgi:hypothetical protein